MDSAPQQDAHTYHCICTNLLFASAQPLSSLPCRTAGLDKAYILSLPQIRGPEDGNEDHLAVSQLSTPGALLQTSLSLKPIIIRREDGFEKRYLRRCGRCGSVSGYHLDWLQFPEIEGAPMTGLRHDIIYLLPGGLMSTEDMIGGKDMSKSIDIGRG